MGHTSQDAALREMRDQIAELHRKIDGLTSAVNRVLRQKKADPVPGDVHAVLHSMTPKQHIALQMLLAGCSNRDIAEQLGVTENTAKVHVRTLASKLGLNTRAKIVAKMVDVMERIDPEDYMEASSGIPKDWHRTMRLMDPDPCAGLYR